MAFPPITRSAAWLIIIVAFVVLFQEPCLSAETESKTTSTESEAANPHRDNQIQDMKDHRIVVYYFHGTFRCFSCIHLEQLTMGTIEEIFGREIRDGVLETKVINVDKQENRHFIQDYQLYTKSVIVSERGVGRELRWKNLTRIWELLRNEESFKSYIQKEISDYLSGTRT